ncbi:MAG: polysaccharide biosynthesis C-terminal domain-containing protein, partial [Propionibacteriaceae bacterium]|nr:polysaccharide biosynthesis C-terminal domain-containing protein [Propionibacteriaceae bacterium]
VVLCLLMGLLAEPLVLLIMGEQYAASVPVLQILAIAVAIINVNQPLAGLLQARGHDKRVAFLLAAAVVTRLVVLVPLVWVLGAVGVALAFVMGESILLIGMLWYARSLRRAAGTP